MSKIFNMIEVFFDSLGMMTGTFPEMKRFLFGAVITGGLLYAFKPWNSIMFDEHGSIRPWNLFDDRNMKATYFPFWMGILLGGSIPALFV